MMRKVLATCVFLAAFALGLPARAAQPDETYDGIVTDSAALPASGSLRLSGGGGTFGAAEGFSAELGIQWTFIHNLALSLSGIMESNQIYDKFSQATPIVSLRWQMLSQAEEGANLTGTVRFKTVGFDPSAGEIELGLAVGRTLGPVSLTLNVVGGHDVDPNGGMDLEGRAQADIAVASRLNVGVEGRFRTGMDPANFPEFGSAWDLVAGPHAVVKLGPVHLQALVGVSGGAGPNAQLLGLGKPSPCAMLNVTGDVI